MKAPITSMQHLNGNLLCAVDTETTGLRSDYHEIIQLGIVPLNGNLDPILDPFEISCQPVCPERVTRQAMKVNGIKLHEITMDRWDAQACFEKWFDKTVTGNGFKKISMLGQNLDFDVPFMKQFFEFDLKNEDNMSVWFDTRNLRDTKRVCEYFNDLAYQNGWDFPFPKTNLNYLCNRFGINSEGAHNALVDAINTAKVYRCLMALRLPMIDFGAVD